MSNKSCALLRCYTLYAISHKLLLVAISSRLTKFLLAWAKGASLGKEAVLAASWQVGEIAVGVGWVRRLRSVIPED